MSLSKNEIKFIRSLQLKKFRDENNLFVVEGVKLVNELCLQNFYQIDSIYHTSSFVIPDEMVELATEISHSELGKISGFKSPNEVLAVVKNRLTIPEPNPSGLIIMLDSINDPGNLGTIMRTAEWFGVKTIFCSPNSVEQYNPKVIQASMGAIFNIHVVYQDLKDAIIRLKEQDYQICGAAMYGDPLYQSKFVENTVLIMGSESHGISEELLSEIDQLITIPKYGKSESLNVGMACGVITSSYRQQFPITI